MPDIGNISSGEANTASNLGLGEGVWKQKTGVDLQFRSLVATSSKIALANNANDIGIDTPNAVQLNTANVYGDFNSEFYDNRIIMWNPARTFKYTIHSQAITSDCILQLPQISGTNTIMVRNGNDALQNKEIDMTRFNNEDGNIIAGGTSDNPYLTGSGSGINYGATYRRTGVYQATCGNCGDGLFDATGNYITIGTSTSILDSNEGRIQQFSTGAAAGNNAGYRCTSTLFRREWNSYMVQRIKLSSTSNIRVFWGWSSDFNEIAGETPLANFSGCGIGKRVADTNWQIIKNDGDATTDFVDSGIAVGTTAVTFQMQLDTTNLRTAIGSTELTEQTTEIPANATNMSFHWEIETSDAVDKNIQLGPCFARTGDAI